MFLGKRVPRTEIHHVKGADRLEDLLSLGRGKSLQGRRACEVLPQEGFPETDDGTLWSMEDSLVEIFGVVPRYVVHHCKVEQRASMAEIGHVDPDVFLPVRYQVPEVKVAVEAGPGIRHGFQKGAHD